jgi:tetratricopeptide (TPR) repeat protein
MYDSGHSRPQSRCPGPRGSVRRVLLLALMGLVAGFVAVGIHYWPERYLKSARDALQSRQYDAARASLLRYLETRPKSSEAHLLLAQLDRRSNRYDDAAAHLDACGRLGGPSDAIDLERALCSVQSGVLNAESVKRCYDHLNKEDADQFLILEALSQGFTKTYHLKEASFCLERMLVLEPDNNYALRRRGWIHFQDGQFDLAEADYRRAVEVDPSDAVARQGLAQILLEVRKDFVEATEHYERLWPAQQESTVAQGLARSWQLLGRTDDARRLLDDWLTSHPEDPLILMERGKLAQEEDASDLAMRLLRRAVVIAPYLIEANHALYQCLSRQGQKAEAEECLTRIRQAKENRKQLTVLTRRLQQAPDDADLRCQVAQLFLQLGQEEEGIRWLQVSLQSHPHHRPSHLALADFYDKAGQATLAVQHRRLAETAR